MAKGLKQFSDIDAEEQVQTSVDETVSFDDENKAMQKVASGRSKGKTIISFFDRIVNLLLDKRTVI